MVFVKKGNFHISGHHCNFVRVALKLNFISYDNHIVRPIEQKGILSGFTLTLQKIGQTNLKNRLCKMKLDI